MSAEPIALIAGNGLYPETFAAAARRSGVTRLVAAAFLDETKPDLAGRVDAIEWFRVGQLGKMIAYFKREGIRRAVMVGHLREDGVRAILTSPYADRKVIDLLAGKTGIAVAVLANQAGALPGTDDYLAWIDADVQVLAKALAR